MCPAKLCWLSYLSTDFGLWRFRLIILIIIWPKNNVYIFLTVAYTILLSLAFLITSYSSNFHARHDNAVVYTDGSVLRGQRSGWVSRRELNGKVSAGHSSAYHCQYQTGDWGCNCCTEVAIVSDTQSILDGCGVSSHHKWRPQPCRNLYEFTVRDAEVFVEIRGQIV